MVVNRIDTAAHTPRKVQKLERALSRLLASFLNASSSFIHVTIRRVLVPVYSRAEVEKRDRIRRFVRLWLSAGGRGAGSSTAS